MRVSPEIERIRSISHAIKTIFRHCWVHRFGCPPASGFRHGPEHHLHLVEFACPGADIDELRSGFEIAHRELCQRAYGFDDGKPHHVGIGHVAQSQNNAGIIVRALLLVHPAEVPAFYRAASTIISGGPTGLSISRCDADPGDPDAAYRWFAEGIAAQAGMLQFDKVDDAACSFEIERQPSWAGAPLPSR